MPASGPVIDVAAQAVRYLGRRAGTGVVGSRAGVGEAPASVGSSPIGRQRGEASRMGYGSFPYQVVYLIHLSCIVVGFGSSFVYPLVAAKARNLPPREAYAVNHTALEVSPYLTSYPIYGAGAAGLLLIVLSDRSIQFSDTWISIAMLVFVLAVLVAIFLHSPNLTAMDALQAKLLEAPAGDAPGEAPPEVAELEERGQKAAMYGGLLHVFWLVLMIDMIWKPGLGS